jgi:hypothetical protein
LDAPRAVPLACIIRRMRTRFALVVFFCLVLTYPAAAQPAGTTPVASSPGENTDKPSQTSHTMRLDGRELKYSATAGTLPIRGEDGKVAARMFYVAYTKDGEDAKARPVSFLYNGGPGSATVWLHMGSFAPSACRWRRGLPARAPLPARRQRQLADRHHRPRLRGRDFDRLQPRRRRRQRRAVSRPAGGPARLRRFHQRVPEDVRSMALAEVP